MNPTPEGRRPAPRPRPQSPGSSLRLVVDAPPTLPSLYRPARRRPARPLAVGLLALTVLAAPVAAVLLDGGMAGAQAKKYDVGSALRVKKTAGATTTASSAPATVPAKIVFVGAGDAGGGNTRSKQVSVPSAAQAGDTALLFLAQTTTATWTGPTGVTGWTQVATYAPNTLRTTVWEKSLTATDLGGSVSFTSSGYSHASASIVVYSGLDAKSPVRATAQAADAGTTTHVTPKVAASTGDWVLSYWADRAGAVRTWTAPSSVAVRVTSPDVAGSALAVQAVIGDSNAAVASSASYGGTTATTDASTAAGANWSLALRAAQVPAPTSSATSVPTTSSPAPTTTTPSPTPTTSSTTTSSSAPAPTSTSPAPSSSCVSNPMGIPSSGAIVGSSAGGTQTLSGLESQVGRLAEHRTYWSANQVSSAVNTASADLAAGRLPWISFKTPYVWADMAAGKGDAWATDIANQLGALNGPVWVAFWHEPENDTAAEGSMADWTAMQAHLAPIVHRTAHNVAYTMILMGWNSLFGPTEDLLANNWPGDGNIDVIGLDLYNQYGVNGSTSQLNFMKYFDKISAFAAAHSTHWGLGETGWTSAAQQNYPTYLQDFFSGLLADGGVAMSYFDSSLNSAADWTLDDPARVSAYKDTLARTTRIC